MTISKEVLARVLTAFLALAQTDPELFHPMDIKMVESNDWWIERFFANNRTEEEATRALIKEMEWRKDYGVHNLTEDEFMDIKESGLHTYDITDKTGRPVVLNRFTQYKRGLWSKERSQRYMVYIYEILDQKCKGSGFVVIGDGLVVNKDNVNAELIYFLLEVLDRYYPLSMAKGVALDLPKFFVDIMNELVKYMSPWVRDTIVFLDSPQLLDIINLDKVPGYRQKRLDPNQTLIKINVLNF